jgi:hypothetical protein
MASRHRDWRLFSGGERGSWDTGRFWSRAAVENKKCGLKTTTGRLKYSVPRTSYGRQVFMPIKAKRLHLLQILAALTLCGCGSIVTTTPEHRLPANKMTVTGVPYYLPKGKIQIDITWSKDTHEWLVKASPVIVPDDRFRYRLNRNTHVLFDDDITIAVDSMGLLQTVNGTSADKTVSAIGDLVAAVGGVFSFAAGVGAALPQGAVPGEKIMEAMRKPTPAPAPVYSYHATIDPREHLNSEPIESVLLTVPENNLPGMASTALRTLDDTNGVLIKTSDDIPVLDNHGSPVRVSRGNLIQAQSKDSGTPVLNPDGTFVLGTNGEPILVKDNTPVLAPPIIQTKFEIKIKCVDMQHTNSPTPAQAALERAIQGMDGCIPGIVVRTPVRYQVTIKRAAGYTVDDNEMAAETSLLLPDDEHDYILPIDRIPLVANSTQVTLAAGTIQNLHLTRPSIVAGIVGIPKTIVGALVPIPINVSQTQDNYYKTRDDAVKAASDTRNYLNGK